MKDYANPLLLLLVIVLMACYTTADSPELQGPLYVWILALCTTGFVVDGALALAKALTHRRALMNVVWSVSYLVLGCCAWGMNAAPLTEEQMLYREQRQAEQNPLVRDAEGETLFARAAALGKVQDVEHIINTYNPPEELLNEAGLRAAENNHPKVLEALARVGLSAGAQVRGVPLLHAAAQNGACAAMEWLLKRGAQVNSRDAEGSTPLIQAAASESLPAVKLLLQYGADTRLRDTTGRSAADFAHTEEMEALLQPTNARQP